MKRTTQRNVEIILAVLLLSVLVVFFALLPDTASAQELKYSPIVNIPGVGDSTSGNIGNLVNALFLIGLVVTAALATVMLAIGGVQYMTTEAVTGKSEGKERIWNAILGLLIALLIWVILSEINPNIVRNLEPQIQQTPSVARAPSASGSAGAQAPGARYTVRGVRIPSAVGNLIHRAVTKTAAPRASGSAEAQLPPTSGNFVFPQGYTLPQSSNTLTNTFPQDQVWVAITKPSSVTTKYHSGNTKAECEQNVKQSSSLLTQTVQSCQQVGFAPF